MDFLSNVINVTANGVIAMMNVCLRKEQMKMKLLNYDTKYLVYQNLKLKPTESNIPITYSKAQYLLLCKIIKQKHISKEFFNFLMIQLFNSTD